ncbi:MAG: ABC transporter substrate-binding protein [Anaerolineae bacterium]
MSEKRLPLLLAVATLVLVMSLLAACTPAATPTPVPATPTPAPPTPTPVPPTPTPAPPTTFSIAVGIDPDTLDPVGMTTTTVANMVDYVIETLVTIDQEGKVVPLLAKSWEISEDGLEYTFTLEEGVTFHDGTPFNAEAVKFSFERMLDPDVRVPIRTPYEPIEKVEAVDPTTVKLTLGQPSAPLLASLSWTTAGIISPTSIDQYGNSYDNYQHPVGTGPYVFEERVKGEHITVTKYEDYWGKKPYYDIVTFRIVPEAATRESLLLAGQVDLIILPPAADIPALQKNADVEVLLAPSDRTIFIAINNLDPVLSDPKVRQALNYAVNKEEIIQSVLFGAADAMDAPMASSLFGYCKTGPYEHDPEKAKTLLTEAGIEELELRFIAPTGRYVQDFQAAQAIAGFLREAGIKTEVATMDWPSYVATIVAPPEENTTQLHYLGWAPAYLDASMQMLQFLSTYAPPGGLATSFYKNPEVDDLITAAEREVDTAKRQDLYCEASKKVWEDAPWIFLWTQRFPIIYSAKVKNVSYLPNEKFYALYAEPVE